MKWEVSDSPEFSCSLFYRTTTLSATLVETSHSRFCNSTSHQIFSSRNTRLESGHWSTGTTISTQSLN